MTSDYMAVLLISIVSLAQNFDNADPLFALHGDNTRFLSALHSGGGSRPS